MDTTLPITGEDYWENSESQADQQPHPINVERLYSAHYAELKKFLVSRSHDKEIVEVILQEIYLRLMDMPDLSKIQMPSAYLNRLAQNLLIDQQRRQSRQMQRFHDKPVEQLDITEQKPDLCDQLHYAQQLKLYEKIIAELPPPTGEILNLHRIDGLTHSEIAKKYGKSKSWVEKKIAKALLHCRKILHESGY